MSFEPRLPFFVYGTLRPAQSNYALLAGRTVREETAHAEGLRLYSLGTYPMALPMEEVPMPEKQPAASRVYGHLITPRPDLYDAVLRDLDRLEEYYPDQPARSWYRRVSYEITLANQTTVQAWIYFGTTQLLQGWHELIPHGDWSAYAQQRGITHFQREQGG